MAALLQAQGFSLLTARVPSSSRSQGENKAVFVRPPGAVCPTTRAYTLSSRVRRVPAFRAMASESTVEEKLGVRVERNPPDSRLSTLGVRSWPKWGCPPSKFPWTYSDEETCYLLKGKVKVYGEGSDKYIEIGAGDLVVFPKGMSCTWEVLETVEKHYSFA